MGRVFNTRTKTIKSPFQGVLQELEITSKPDDAAEYCDEKLLGYDEEVSDPEASGASGEGGLVSILCFFGRSN